MRLHFTITTVALITLAGCVGQPGSTMPADSAARCREPYVDVINTSNNTVDVFARVSSGGPAFFLGTVPPGQERLVGFEGMSYPTAEVNGRRAVGVRYVFGCGR